MIDPHLLYEDRMQRQAEADDAETLERAKQLRAEMLDAILTGRGVVRHLNSGGHRVTMSPTEAWECYADVPVVLALLREIEADQRVPSELRLRIGGLFAQVAADFADVAAENAR